MTATITPWTRLSRQTRKAAKRLERDFELFAAASWRIRTKVDGLQPWRLNACQRIIWETIKARWRDHRPAWVKILKLRQGGISTFACGLAQHQTMYNPHMRALSIADKADLPRTWLRRGRSLHEQLPPQLRPHLGASNQMELWYDRIDSRWYIGSSAGQTPGMGDTLSVVHCSELADWLEPEKLFRDLEPAVPNHWRTIQIREGTGEYDGDWWCEDWYATWRGEDDWVALFLPWFIQEDYRTPTTLTPADYDADEKDLVTLAEDWARRNPEHAAIARFYGITPDHIQWRRWAIANLFAGDVEAFRCKYPATPAEAFMSVGRAAIPRDIVQHHATTATPPLECVRLKWTDDRRTDVTAQACSTDDPRGWWIWARPHGQQDYAIGGDVAEGILSDPNDQRSERDYHYAFVLDRSRMHQTARFRGQQDPDVFGDECAKAAYWFNRAWLGIEINNAGFAALSEVRRIGYTKLLTQEGPLDSIDQMPLARLGWRTTTGNRQDLITDWIAACRPNHDDWSGSVLVRDKLLVNEERTMIVTRTGKREHRPGRNDDSVLAAAIALQVHQHCPRDMDTRGKTLRRPVARRPERDGFLVGQLDPGIPSLCPDHPDNAYRHLGDRY